MSEYGVFISRFLIQRNSSIFQSSYEVFYPLKYVYLQIYYHEVVPLSELYVHFSSIRLTFGDYSIVSDC